MASKVKMGRLQRYAENQGIDTEDKSYEKLREIVDINECRHCGDEYLTGWNGKFCSDTCEVEYIHENDFD